MSDPVDGERLRALLEHSLDAIALVDPDGTVSFVSPGVSRVLGYSPEEFVGLRPFEIVHPDDRDAAVLRHAELARRPAGTHTVLNRVRHKDGSWRWIETVSTNQLDNPGLRAVVANFRDITDRRRMEDALREREEHFRLIVDSAVDFAIFTLGLDGRIRSWNIGAERVLGYTEAEIVGRHVSVIFTPEDNARGRAAYEMANAERNGHEKDDRWHMKKGGVRFWANGMMMPLKDEAGVLHGYLKILRDRTEQKRARDALARSEERLRIAVDAARLGLWHRDLLAGTLAWDARCKEHFGLGPDAAVDDAAYEERLHPDDRAPARAAMARAIAERTPYDHEHRTVARDGRVRWIQAIGRAFYDEAGAPSRLDGVTIDVTERKLAEEARREADRRKDEFLAMLGHELRNPLAAINGAVELLLRPARDEDLAWSKDVISRQARHLARLVDDLLDVSRLTLGKLELREERIDLAPIVARAVETVRPLVEANRQHLNVSLPAGPLDIRADPARIEQVLASLLSNAASYTGPGGHIELAAELGPELVVTVKDDGVGIAPELLPHIFDLFTQDDRTIDRARGGLGIGLTLVRRLVALHGGTVTAASEGPGAGSVFTVRIPLGRGSADDEASPEPVSPAQAPRGLRVLVVDDNQDTAAGMTRLLRASGFAVTTVHDGLAALDAARADCPDVVLMDIGLPGMDGYHVAEQVRAIDACRDALLVAISGYSQDHDRRRSLMAGFDHHFAKPVDFDRLLALLARQEPRDRPPGDDPR